MTIQQFKIDDKTSQFKFSDRLASENLWTIEYAKRCMEEYLKFIFLVSQYKQMTPSIQVDEVWHLHMIYTRSYRELCELVGRFLDHGPTKGGEKEDVRYFEQYTNTLSLYRKHFGEYPTDIWPSPEERFSPQQFVKVDIMKHYIIPVGDKKSLIKLLFKF